MWAGLNGSFIMNRTQQSTGTSLLRLGYGKTLASLSITLSCLAQSPSFALREASHHVVGHAVEKSLLQRTDGDLCPIASKVLSLSAQRSEEINPANNHRVSPAANPPPAEP